MAQAGIDARPMLWALGAALERRFGSVQPFFATADHCDFTRTCLGAARPARHLDSWIMSRQSCRQFFWQGMTDANVGLVIAERPPRTEPIGSDWQTIGDWLDCPRIAVVDVSQIEGCNVPVRPPHLDGILLDGPRDLADACRWGVSFEALWGVPVLGWLGELPPLRAIATHLRSGVKPGAELRRILGANLDMQLDWPRLDALLARKPFFPCCEESCRRGSAAFLGSSRIALALDDAFDAYHGDTLDWLAGAGAEIVDFSPLKDGGLPDEVDVVYLGSHDLTDWLPRLSANHCMHQALRTFAARGGRIYAEGPGAAYLGRTAQLGEESPLPMAGLLPLKSKRLITALADQPAEVVTSCDSWLAPAGTRLRGYRSGAWQIDPAGPLLTYCTRPAERCTMLGRNQVIASHAALHLAAHPALLNSFFKPGVVATVPAVY